MNNNYRSMDNLYKALVLARDNDLPVQLTSREAGKLLGEILTLKVMVGQLSKEITTHDEGICTNCGLIFDHCTCLGQKG